MAPARPIGSAAHLAQVRQRPRAARGPLESRWPAWLLPLVAVALTSQSRAHGAAVVNSFAGPYIVYADRIYMCAPPYDQLPWKWYARVSHFNPHRPKEIQRLNGNITAGHETGSFDNSGWVKLYLDGFSNNQWKENSFVIDWKKEGCLNIKRNLPYIYRLFYIKEKEDESAPCEIKTGIYEIKNASVPWIFPKFPIMPYGRYRARFTAGKKEPFGCWVVETRVIPRYD